MYIIRFLKQFSRAAKPKTIVQSGQTTTHCRSAGGHEAGRIPARVIYHSGTQTEKASSLCFKPGSRKSSKPHTSSKILPRNDILLLTFHWPKQGIRSHLTSKVQEQQSYHMSPKGGEWEKLGKSSNGYHNMHFTSPNYLVHCSSTGKMYSPPPRKINLEVMASSSEFRISV